MERHLTNKRIKEELIMGRNSNSLQHELLRQVLSDIENNKTSTAYKRHIKNFAKWAKGNGYKKPESITAEVIQEYENYPFLFTRTLM